MAEVILSYKDLKPSIHYTDVIAKPVSWNDYTDAGEISNPILQKVKEKVKEKEMKVRNEIPFKCLVKRVIFNPPATIVFWKDNTKTVVKCIDGEKFVPYYGFLAALAKKVYGTNSEVNRILKDAVYEKSKEETKTKDIKECVIKAEKKVYVCSKPIRDEKGKFVSSKDHKKKSKEHKKK